MAAILKIIIGKMTCIVWCECLWKPLSGKMASKCIMQMPVKTTLRLYCGGSHLVQVCVKSSMYCDTVALLLSIVYKNENATVKLHESERKMEIPLPQQRFCYLYTCEEVTRGQQRSVDLKSSFIFIYCMLYPITVEKCIGSYLYILSLTRRYNYSGQTSVIRIRCFRVYDSLRD